MVHEVIGVCDDLNFIGLETLLLELLLSLKVITAEHNCFYLVSTLNLVFAEVILEVPDEVGSRVPLRFLVTSFVEPRDVRGQLKGLAHVASHSEEGGANVGPGEVGAVLQDEADVLLEALGVHLHQVLLILVVLVRLGKELIVHPQHHIGSKASVNLPDANVKLLVFIAPLTPAAEKLRTHAKKNGVSGPVLRAEVGNGPASGAVDVEDAVPLVGVLAYLRANDGRCEVDPLEYFARLKVLDLGDVVNLDCARALADVGLKIRNGSGHPPLNLVT